MDFNKENSLFSKLSDSILWMLCVFVFCCCLSGGCVFSVHSVTFDGVCSVIE